MEKLIAAYDEYLELLGEAERHMLGIAWAHGYRVPQAMVKRGEKLRAKIARLKAKLSQTNT